MAVAFAKVAAKVTVAGGVIYWSIQQGIWGTSKEGSEAGKRLTNSIAQPVRECVEKIPSLAEVNVSAKDCWNTGVSTLFQKISQMPNLEGIFKERVNPTTTDWTSAAVLNPSPSKLVRQPKHGTSQEVFIQKNIHPTETSPIDTSPKKASPEIISQTDASDSELNSKESMKMKQPERRKPNDKTDMTKIKYPSKPASIAPTRLVSKDNNVQKPFSFKISKTPQNEYVVEPTSTSKPASSYTLSKQEGVKSPPKPITSSNLSKCSNQSDHIVINGCSYLTSLASPPKPCIRVSSSLKVQSVKKNESNRCSDDEIHSYYDAQVCADQIELEHCRSGHLKTDSFAEKPSSFVEGELSAMSKSPAIQTLQGTDDMSPDCNLPLSEHFSSCDMYLDETSQQSSTGSPEEKFITHLAEADHGKTPLQSPENKNGTSPVLLTESNYGKCPLQSLENKSIASPARLIEAGYDKSPLRPKILASYTIDRPVPPTLVSNLNPTARFSDIIPPKTFYTASFGRRTISLLQKTATVVEGAIGDHSPPEPTLLPKKKSNFYGIKSAEISRSLSKSSRKHHVSPSKSSTHQDQLIYITPSAWPTTSSAKGSHDSKSPPKSKSVRDQSNSKKTSKKSSSKSSGNRGASSKKATENKASYRNTYKKPTSASTTIDVVNSGSPLISKIAQKQASYKITSAKPPVSSITGGMVSNVSPPKPTAIQDPFSYSKTFVKPITASIQGGLLSTIIQPRSATIQDVLTDAETPATATSIHGDLIASLANQSPKSEQSDLKTPAKPATTSYHRGLIGNLTQRTPTFMVPSMDRPPKSENIPKAAEP